MCCGFLSYKSPGFFSYLFVDRGYISLPVISGVLVIFNLMVAYLESQHESEEKKLVSLKRINKDIKLQLLGQMDPLVVETLREIVRSDMKTELEEMRNSDKGCSQKCQLMKVISEKELNRNHMIVKVMLEFEWCNDCSVA